MNGLPFSVTVDSSRFAYRMRRAALVLLAIVPVLYAFRGLDLTDTGFLATNQQLFFSSPEHVSYWFHLWLTNFLGALVYLGFGRWGLLSFKLAAAVIFWLTSWGVLALYGPRRKSSLVWLALALSIVFSFDEKINIVHYNNLSSLFYIWGLAFLVHGILERSSAGFFIAGSLLTLNIFVRLPNILGLGLLLLVPLTDLFTRGTERRYRVGGKMIFHYSLGATFAGLTVFGIMAIFGHLDLYWSAIRDLGGEAAKSSGRYGLVVVAMRPIKATLQALLVGGVSLAALLSIGFGVSRFKFVASGLIFPLLAAMGTAVLVIQPIPSKFYHLAVAGMAYWAALFAVFTRAFDFDRRIRLTLILSAGVILFLSAGSDTIISVSTYAFGAALPALLIWFEHIEAEGIRVSPRWTLRARGVCAAAVAAGFVYSVAGLWTGVYRDTYELGTTSRVPMLAHIATSRERARELDELVPRIQTLAPEGSEVLIADSLGLLHFATKTLPYLGNPWPVLWSEPEIAARLEARVSSNPLPLVVLARNNPRYGWPVSKRLPNRIEPFRKFVQDHRYVLAWQSEATEIWTPSGVGSGAP